MGRVWMRAGATVPAAGATAGAAVAAASSGPSYRPLAAASNPPQTSSRSVAHARAPWSSQQAPCERIGPSKRVCAPGAQTSRGQSLTFRAPAAGPRQVATRASARAEATARATILARTRLAPTVCGPLESVGELVSTLRAGRDAPGRRGAGVLPAREGGGAPLPDAPLFA